MRFLLFALMIALLPLRGWVGEAMATEMALAQPGQRITMKSIAVNAHETWTKPHFDHKTVGVKALHGVQTQHEARMPQPQLLAHDCAGHASPEHGSPACDSCPACQACHTVALDPHAACLPDPAFSALALASGAAARFASADTARDQKPPIS